MVVAIPAKDESDRLGACLQALVDQRDEQARPLARDLFDVIVFANNCRDDSAAVARRAAADCPFAIVVVEAQLPPRRSHAGGARRAAMDLAATWLQQGASSDGLILTTDADSRVTPNWICANLAAFAEGADAVLGRLSLDEDGARLPPTLHARGKLEAVYEDLLTEISARLDPEEANPWPHHATISGASLAVRRGAYLRVGGLPRQALGEDKAFVAALRRHDARIRFAPDAHVVTSGRIVGRAPGGVADTLRLRSEDPNALCDETLEPCGIAFKRALWRGRLRRGGLGGSERWRASLCVPASAIQRFRATSTFGEAWEAVEQSSPRLTRYRLRPADLPLEIARATRALQRLQDRLTSDEDIDSVLRQADEPDRVGEGANASYEQLGRVVAR